MRLRDLRVDLFGWNELHNCFDKPRLPVDVISSRIVTFHILIALTSDSTITLLYRIHAILSCQSVRH